MEIYLIQHAVAKSDREDPVRPLSQVGEAQMKRIAEHVAGLGVKVDRIYHSGKLRAQQTAEILAKYTEATDRVEVKEGLDPGDEVGPIRDWLDQLADEGVRSVAIIGHLPFLNNLASLLVTGNQETRLIAFENAGVVKLAPKPLGKSYCLSWILTPGLI